MRERDTFVDVAKGLAILIVICIHSEVFGVIGNPFAFIAVPLFFFMSGFYDRSEKSFDRWVPKSLRTLIVPAVVWIVIGTVYGKFLFYLKAGNLGDNPYTWYDITWGDGPAWFLFALLYAKILQGCMERIAFPWWIRGGIIIGIGYLGMMVNLPLLLDEGCAAFPLYAAGKIVYPRLMVILRKKWSMALGVLALGFVFGGLTSFVIVPGGSGYSPYYVLAILIVFLTFFPFLWFSLKLEKVKLLSKFGKQSLGILLLHAPMCHTAAVILNRVFEKGSCVWIVCFLIAFFLIIGMSYLLTVFIERYCPILLGKKTY